MLLLLLLGTGPNVAGVRAYGAVSFAVTNAGALTMAVVNPAQSSTTLVNSASATEE